MNKIELGIHKAFACHPTPVRWVAVAGYPCDDPKDLSSIFWLKNGYFFYKKEWVLFFDLPWHVRKVLKLIMKLGIDVFRGI